MKFNVILDNSEFSIESCDHALGHKWAMLLKQTIDKDGTVYFNDRIYNLNYYWTKERVVHELNECIHIINAWEYFIDHEIDEDKGLDQELLNILHKYFEDMRGAQEDPNEFYKNAPRKVKHTIDQYNVLIHRYEDFGNPGRIVVNMNSELIDLEPSDYQHWTLDWKPGDIRLNYCHKGKTLWDVFKDDDLYVGEENIRPQSKYSSDFIVSFNSGPINHKDKFDRWWDLNKLRLSELGFEKDDPRNALGYAVVGRLQYHPSVIRERIFGARKILGVTYED